MSRLASSCVAALVLCPGATAQTRQVFHHAVERAEWAVADIAELRFGRVALVAYPDGPRLEVRSLRDVIPSAPTLHLGGATPSFDGTVLVVGDFARSNRSPLGGYFSTFMRAPSLGSATVRRTSDTRRALTLACDRRETGFCGLWIQLYDFDLPLDQRRYLDATPFSTLSFWIRGHAGGERLLLKVADARWELKEDAVPVGEVGAFLPSGRIDTLWQQAVVPLRRFPRRVDRGTLALLVWEALSTGVTGVDLGPVALSTRRGELPALPDPQPIAETTDGVPLATWIWNTRDLLADSTYRDGLLDSLAREGVSRVFLQLPDPPEPRGRRGAPGEIAFDPASLRPLLARFHARGMKVYALDGYARYALPEYHAGVLATVDHVIRYNAGSEPSERFFGIRYDIEPYVMPAFQGPRRDQVLRGLLDLTARSAERARAAGLAYGVDIPFWYDAPDEITSQPVAVEWNGVRKPVSQHLIDLVDDLSIMDYRTTAYGADGTIRHAMGELRYAAQQGKPVFIGLETSDLPDELEFEFGGEPRHGIPDAWPAGASVVLFERGDSLQVYLIAAQAESRDSAAAEENPAAFLAEGFDPRAVRWWPITRRVAVPAAKITFARLGPDRLREVMAGTKAELERFPSFAGFALHHAESFLALVQTSPTR